MFKTSTLVEEGKAESFCFAASSQWIKELRCDSFKNRLVGVLVSPRHLFSGKIGTEDQTKILAWKRKRKDTGRTRMIPNPQSKARPQTTQRGETINRWS